MVFLLFPWSAQAEKYYDQKWFDIPDAAAPRTTTTCAREACADVPVVDRWTVRIERRCACVNPIVSVELLRRDVRVVVSGPDTAEAAVKNAVVGYVGGCIATATAAATAGPQVVVSPAGFYASFKACIAALSLSGAIGSVLNQLDIQLNTLDTHWAPV